MHVLSINARQLRFLLDTHGAALTLYARQWCRAPEDALQEALIDLLRQTPPPEHPVAWLFKTIRRRAMNLARGEQRRAKYHRQASRERDAWFLPTDNVLDVPIDVESLVRRLPTLEREIIVARIWGELSFAQISDLVGRSTSSVHRRYRQALAELKQMMDDELDTLRQDR